MYRQNDQRGDHCKSQEMLRFTPPPPKRGQTLVARIPLGG